MITTEKIAAAQPTRFAICAAFLSVGNNSHRRHIHMLPTPTTSTPATAMPMEGSTTPSPRQPISVSHVNTPMPLDVLASALLGSLTALVAARWWLRRY